MDVMALLTIVTTVEELFGGEALALAVTHSIALLLTGPLMAVVTVFTAG